MSTYDCPLKRGRRGLKRATAETAREKWFSSDTWATVRCGVHGTWGWCVHRRAAVGVRLLGCALQLGHRGTEATRSRMSGEREVHIVAHEILTPPPSPPQPPTRIRVPISHCQRRPICDAFRHVCMYVLSADAGAGAGADTHVHTRLNSDVTRKTRDREPGRRHSRAHSATDVPPLLSPATLASSMDPSASSLLTSGSSPK